MSLNVHLLRAGIVFLLAAGPTSAISQTFPDDRVTCAVPSFGVCEPGDNNSDVPVNAPAPAPEPEIDTVVCNTATPC